jgi:hypothetical protein
MAAERPPFERIALILQGGGALVLGDRQRDGRE